MYAGTRGARGKIHFIAEELQDNKFVIHFELSASQLEKKDLFGKVDNGTPVAIVHNPLSSYWIVHACSYSNAMLVFEDTAPYVEGVMCLIAKEGMSKYILTIGYDERPSSQYRTPYIQ